MGGLRPLARQLGQQAHHQVAESGRQLGVEVSHRDRRVHGDRRQQGHQVVLEEGQAPRTHAVEHDAEAVQVAAGVDVAEALGLLRGHVGRRAQNVAGLRQMHVLLRQAGQAEVDDLDPAAAGFEPDVGGLDVAVDQSARVRRRQARRDLPADTQDLGQRRHFRVLEPALQRLALEQGHGEVGNAVVLADLIDGDNVIVLDGGGGAGLAEETLAAGRIAGHRAAHDLERDGALQLRVLGREHDAHAAGAKYLEDAIGTEPAEFPRPLGRQQAIVILRNRGGPVRAGRRSARLRRHRDRSAGQSLRDRLRQIAYAMHQLLDFRTLRHLDGAGPLLNCRHERAFISERAYCLEAVQAVQQMLLQRLGLVVGRQSLEQLLDACASGQGAGASISRSSRQRGES